MEDQLLRVKFRIHGVIADGSFDSVSVSYGLALKEKQTVSRSPIGVIHYDLAST